MQIFKGIAALSDFRRNKLIKQLQVIDANISDVQAEYIHFVDTKNKLSPKENTVLARLLTYGESFQGKPSDHLVLIVPRIGTISGWSSKATDIAHNSGLNDIERIERGIAYYIKSSEKLDVKAISSILHDRMTESALFSIESAAELFAHHKPKTFTEVNILNNGIDELKKINNLLGLALSEDEIDYLYNSYQELKRNPSDVELMMFSVVNSEHCRHKIFNANWEIDGKKDTRSLFKSIKNTYEHSSVDILSAYSDNAAVLKGPAVNRIYPDPKTGEYKVHNEAANLVIKVETHNHPTAVSPIPGAATGIGGEIRDEAATGRGARTKMGLAGFTVSNLNIPNHIQPWEHYYGKPSRIVSALDIMIDGPIGGASYSNEFGRPNLAGYFRTYEQSDGEKMWGYHKPIMIAGGLGNIKTEHVEKKSLQPGNKVIILGGPSMLVGVGGGTSASMHAGESEEDLDFASVQRANAEIERRAQEVINSCWTLGDKNPIITIHDVGAGGISNALPELVHDSNLGAKFELRTIPVTEPGMSPLEIWCNEAQERFVLGIDEKDLALFRKICERERCPITVVGEVTKKEHLVLTDSKFKNKPIDIPMSLLFGKAPKMTRKFNRTTKSLDKLNINNIQLTDAIERVLKVPTVGSKNFLITIGDRSVGGLTVRDQMIGPWQVPVSDVAVTASSFGSQQGEAMAIGERTPIALIDSTASARMAVGEAITNIAAAPITKLSDVKLSANWMAAAGHENEDQHLFDAVRALGEEFCPTLDITIPVGKDSLSMRTSWQENHEQKSVTSPLSVIISAFAPVNNTSNILTPQLQPIADSSLILIDLGEGRNRLGGSILAQTYNQIGDQSADIEPGKLKSFFKAIQQLNQNGWLMAYHDRSDGGLFVTLAEMMFAGRVGITVNLDSKNADPLAALFSEELGAVIQVNNDVLKETINILEKSLRKSVHVIGKAQKAHKLTIMNQNKKIYENSRSQLEQWWSSTSYHIQRLRDNPTCADEEFASLKDDSNPGISPKVTFGFLPESNYKVRPKVAVFREQGVNGQTEMAAGFNRANFETIDVHLNDLISGRFSLDDFSVLAVCGGFSYGDVLGAGEGWAKSILHNQNLRKQFKRFFERKDTLSLGTCNGCQMLAGLKEIIPGADHWPTFKKNLSEQFEARLASVKVNKTPSVFLNNMENSILPIHVAHGEGRAVFDKSEHQKAALKNFTPLQYVDNYANVTTAYPYNPNGSPEGITALTSKDGRATIIMPHPERGFLSHQFSWHPQDWQKDSPWLRLFQNAREWVDR